jgi:hypothetical protein
VSTFRPAPLQGANASSTLVGVTKLRLFILRTGPSHLSGTEVLMSVSG